VYDVVLRSHEVQILDAPGEQGNTPPVADLQTLIVDLQRALPPDFFDPTGTVETTYIDPTLRISCMVGERLKGVRTVFRRRAVS
jgi:hypothetical protein